MHDVAFSWRPRELSCSRRLASIYARTPVRTRTAEIWKKDVFLIFSKQIFFIIKSGWLINFSRYIGMFTLVFALSFFYYSIILMASLAIFSRKHSTLPTTPETFLRINLLKMSCGKRWKWHFRDAKFNGIYIKACVQNKAQLCASSACISGYALSDKEQN